MRRAKCGAPSAAILDSQSVGRCLLQGGAYLQSSAAAVSLFNKWGSLGVANGTLLWRAFDDLAQAAASQVERGDWKSATPTAEKLLTLELFEQTPQNNQTGKERRSLARMPRICACRAGWCGELQCVGQEPAATARLAQAWLWKVPTYISGSATREEKLRVARLSQLLGANVFASDAGRTRTIALAVDAVRGSYGPGALPVLAEYEMAVEAAKRERVARQVEAFRSPSLPYRAPDKQIAARRSCRMGSRFYLTALLTIRSPQAMSRRM